MITHRIIQAKSSEVEKLKMVERINEELKSKVEFEKRKVFEVEAEIREILHERENEKIKLQKQMEIISKNIFNS